ncbi:MATE family efflux transporter [Aliivibrio salmonicida]|uniref:Multidrug resistance protein NorM n=1 Tax=Aliivibrio salmonicida (strain LFI1238) TaxID=316275 RepID=B6EKI1_ALISL|nr:MATE family efflux transporter [Aliivibrio salmonicida]AZL84678.1 MATE family efflux transporter [Aliivibrio salmonicida]CAQ79067.1 multidrug resistance protein NorM (sodium/drug antiporter) [Aliivibrio salmonicida LFI1238]
MHRYQKEIVRLIKLSTPVLIASVAQTGMGFVDTVMAGGVSATDMAAVAIAASVWLPAILFGVGLLMALVPVVAQLNGSGKSKKIPFEIHQGIYLALLISIPIMVILYNAGHIIALMNVEPELYEKTKGYLHAVLWAAPAFLLFQALRSFCEGLSLTIPAMVIGFIGLAANIPLNWMFVYGKLGAPPLGGVGCGIATAIVYWLMFVAMIIYTFVAPKLRRVNLYENWNKPQLKEIYRLFKLGLPVALSIFFEVTLFAAVALLVSPLGSTVVAAHQVAINFSSLIFMVPMSIAIAVSIRVGQKLGENDLEGARIASYCGLAFGLLMAFCTAILTVLFRESIAYLYTDNVEVVHLAVSLMLLAAVYQCTDAVQVVAAGALRGYKDMTAIFKRTFISYWIVGLPAGYILGMTDWIVEPMGVYGFWIGFIGGLSTAAILLSLRLRWLQKNPQHINMEVDELQVMH